MPMSRILVMVIAMLLVSSCADSAESDPQEPVAPSAGESPYPEDPDLKPADPDGASPPKDEELPGQLTEDPFGAPKLGASGADEGIAASTPSDETLPLPETDLSASFNDAASPASEPAAKPKAAPAANKKKSLSATKAAGKASKASAATTGKKVTRYVRPTMLNVRAKPSLKAPVVKRLLGGSSIEVELHGAYAKIGEGQWVRSKHLSATPTKKISRSEAEKAWKGAKGKDQVPISDDP